VVGGSGVESRWHHWLSERGSGATGGRCRESGSCPWRRRRQRAPARKISKNTRKLIDLYLMSPTVTRLLSPTRSEERNAMSESDVPQTLHDGRQVIAIANRLKRAHGQLGAVVRMLDDGCSCESIVTQMAAVTKAVNTAAFALISTSLKECIVDGAEIDEPVTEKFQKLFLSLA
jgi:DNA-binding FrmR family transcriptional regulator